MREEPMQGSLDLGPVVESPAMTTGGMKMAGMP